MLRPFVCHTPINYSSPLIFSSPHSGRIYNKSFLMQATLNLKEVRISEDFYVDQLLAPVTEFGAFFLEACFPRSFVDVNRSPDELDQKLISDLKTGGTNSRTLAGLGVIPRVVGDGIEIYDHKLCLQEVNYRLRRYYHPYHYKLQALVNQAIKHFGLAVLFDFHSMPHNCLENFTDKSACAPQIVLGDCFGSSCSSEFSKKVFDIFVSEGFRVKRNSPFSGGFITKNYGVSRKNVEAIQIEIDRSMYMDENTFELSSGFLDLREKLKKVYFHLSNILEEVPGLIRAAE